MGPKIFIFHFIPRQMTLGNERKKSGNEHVFIIVQCRRNNCRVEGEDDKIQFHPPQLSAAVKTWVLKAPMAAPLFLNRTHTHIRRTCFL